jgi:hypothetical protein
MDKGFIAFLRRLWYIYFRGTCKNSHLLFFTKSLVRYYTPKWFTRSLRNRKLNRFYKLSKEEQAYIQKRVDYYCKFHDSIVLPDDAPPLSQFTYKKKESYVHDYVNSTYFFDAYEYTRFFSDSLRWAYNPGDVNYLFPLPEITKSRPITADDGNRNNMLLNLDKVRHFTWINDPYSWEEKACCILFRGDIKGKPRRQQFIDMWKEHPLCNISDAIDMTLYDHLKVRYIMSLEGNDVASNLKWVMSSNSIAVMPRPTCETWYMEGQLIPNYHYIEIASDYHDLIDRINYYEAHPEEAKAIIQHAHEWVAQFQNKKREDLISLMVLDKYFRLTGQSDATLPKRYVINEIVKLSNQQKVNAQGKAREDVIETLKDIDFNVHDITFHKYFAKKGERPHHYPFFSKWLADQQGKKFIKQVKAGDTILIQEFYLHYMQHIATESRKRGATVIFLIHDVQCIRFNKVTSEIAKLNNASLLLVHTEAMKDKLTELGVTTPMRVMQLFDYYASTPMVDAEETLKHKQDVVFAGNLAKSDFLKELLNNNTNHHINLILYGLLGDLHIDEHKNIIYNGVFNPNDTSTICGGWGLVWDGPTITSCSGDYGEYLRYNSSHKTSLYLACGMPIIVWEHSSLAHWVQEQHIGIVISSLKHLDDAINAISDEDYRQMVNNARKVGQQLREGSFLKQALKLH